MVRGINLAIRVDGRVGRCKPILSRHRGGGGVIVSAPAPRRRLRAGLMPRSLNDGLVYVGDRVNNRIQMFQLAGKFVKEVYIERKTEAGEGTAFDVAFSPDKQQQFFYVPGGSNKKVQVVNRQTLELVGFFGGHGGHGPRGFFHHPNIVTPFTSNLYPSA